LIADNAGIAELRGVGPHTAQRLAQLGINRVEDFWFHFPLRYQDRTTLVSVARLRPGRFAVVEGVVRKVTVVFPGRRTLVVEIEDAGELLQLRFFNFSAAQQRRFQEGEMLRCFGEVRRGRTAWEMIHPEIQRVGEQPLPLASTLTPVYPLVQGVGQNQMRNFAAQALARLPVSGEPDNGLPLPADVWPPSVTQDDAFPDLVAAIRYIHTPPAGADLQALQDGRHPAQQRLIVEELMAHHLSLRQLRQRYGRRPAPPLNGGQALAERFLAQLPFQLTAAQTRALEMIAYDIQQTVPMQRLLQGDVGSGKTLVAALAMLRAVGSGYQAALMAPTELLAAQLQANLRNWFAPLGIEVAGLTASVSQGERRPCLARIAAGEVPVVVGTHALFQEAVTFGRLGLVVIDEQHRFGVNQRLAMVNKGSGADGIPHQLIMTATPIPRTLAMTVYADLDVAVIDELPPGRQPVDTVVLPDRRRDDIVQRISDACGEGRQVYWVCPLIEESETLDCQSATETAEWLQHSLPGCRVGLVHGRLSAPDKQTVMKAFRDGRLDILVATTVIEVGVDVPRASLMIIENAERLGLAQLHQLRGRVGRGSEKSVCVLMYKTPLSRLGRSRLAAMRETSDGFEIARRDLELRGPGEVLGKRQSGAMNLRIADLVRDQSLLPAVQNGARYLAEHCPERIPPLIQRWVGEGRDFGSV
jgi:ATP-dependent DNA helicase RecG